MLDKLKEINLNTLLRIAMIIFILLYLKQCGDSSNLKDELKISLMNQKALTDSLSTYKSKNGSLVYEKGALVSSKKELKDLNNNLSKELAYLKKNPKIVIKEVIKIVHETIKVPTYIVRYPDGTTGLKWSVDTTYSEGNYQKISGETSVKIDTNGTFTSNPVTILNQNEFGISLTTGLTTDPKGYRIFVRSDYPGFSVTNLEGAIIDKKMIKSNESSFVIGPSLGYGIIFAPGGTVNHGVIMGVSASYNLNKPIKKLFRPFGL